MMNAEYNLNGRIWIEVGGVKVLGHGRVELLERINESGSIRQAALQMEMSYRQAWELIKQMNTLFGQPVLITHRGGKGGSNATVTEFGITIINEFKKLQEKFNSFLTLSKFTIK